jgi:RNA polymerase sigma-70 factor (ECF subfamily)
MEAFTVEEFERNFRALYQPLCLFALRVTERPEDAEDIVQQAFADIWDKRRTADRIADLKAYLYRTVRNRSLSHAAQTNRLQPLDNDPAGADDDDLTEQIERAERDAHLWNAIDRLPPERKRIFLLAKRDGLKYQEIADRLHLSVKTVENQIGKALKTLRKTVVRMYIFLFG